MAKNNPEEESSSSQGGGWITTYADMITLLMCFFVIMYSASEPSQSKWEQLKGGIESDVMNVENPTPLADLYEILEAKYDDPEDDDPDLKAHFGPIAEALKANEQIITDELLTQDECLC